MKTKLLLILLFISSYTFAQNWSQVGAAQFTDFASDGAMSFHPVTGEPYVIYSNLIDGNKPNVMKFDGTNWVSVGTVISTESSLNHAIKFNPITNEPWIAYRRTSDDKIDAYRFDGTNWVVEGTALGSTYSDTRLQIQFNASGNPRIAAKTTNVRFHIFTYNTGTFTSAQEATISPIDQNWDFTSYDSYYTSVYKSGGQYYIGKKNVGSSATQFIYSDYDQIRPAKVSGIADDNYAIYQNINSYYYNNNYIRGESASGHFSPPYTQNNIQGILEFRKSTDDGNFYLMWADSNNNLVFKKYSKNSSSWSGVTAPGISTSHNDFFVKMVISPVDGDMYIMYFDSGKASVKRFNIPDPVNIPTIYVNANVSGGDGSGDSWTNATTDLSSAMANAGPSTTEIWVAAGTYMAGTSRNDSFEINKDNLQVYGGFDGTETSIFERNIGANPTILSGDLNGDDIGVGQNGFNRLDNSKNIVTINGENITIDGLIISDAHYENTTGGEGVAIFKNYAVTSFTMKNCTVKDNYAYTIGVVSTRFNSGGSLTIENCMFDNNNARYASGLYVLTGDNQTVTVDITNSLFTNNISKDRSATYKGYTGSSAWIRANGTSSNLTTIITNCTFANNTDIGTISGSQRGTLALARRTDGSSTHNTIINNSIFYNNEGAGGATTVAVNQGHVSMPNLTLVNNSIDEDSFSNLTYLTNTSNSNPLFADASNNDFTLQTGSPAIDSGDNTKVPSGVTTDLLGNQRIFNSTVDMGVYEFGSTTLSDNDFQLNKNVIKLYPNPTSSVLHIKMNTDLEKVEIYNLQGQKVLESNLNSINVSNIPVGLYLIKIMDSKGKLSAKRFIKH